MQGDSDGVNWQKFVAKAKESGFPMLAGLAIITLVVGYFAGSHVQWSAPVDAGDRVAAAVQDFHKGYGDAAVRLLGPLADAGNATAQYWLADMYLEGYDVKADPARAVELLTKSASQNYVPAELRIGQIYLNGHVVLQDFGQARNWLTKAGLAGDTDAARDLAQIYERGWGVTADPSEAYAWDAVAASRGSALAERERDRILKDLTGDAVVKAEARAKELDRSVKMPAGPPHETGSKRS